jgi:hypothetical protein
MLRLYGKFILQVLVVAVSSLIAALQNDRVDAAEWILVLLAVAQAVSVLGAGNLPAGVWRYTKVGAASLIAGLSLLVAFVSDGGVVTSSEWLQVLVAVLGAAGIPLLKGPVLQPAGVAGPRDHIA